MPYHSAIQFCHQRFGESTGGAQRIHYEMLPMVADLQGLECGDSHLSYRANIARRLAPDSDLWNHDVIFHFLSVKRNRELSYY